jgi:uncharacterized protein
MAVLLAGMIVAWSLLMRRFGAGDIYAVIGPYACGVSATLIALRARALRVWLRPSARAIAIGVVVGVGMTLLTYPTFRLAAALWPDLRVSVHGLYAGASSTTPPTAVAWLVAIVLAEELLFRGVLPDLLQSWLAEGSAYLLCWIVYGLAQYGPGSLIVVLMAVVCGAVWTLQRRYTASLWSPLIAHLIWTPVVIVLYPVA